MSSPFIFNNGTGLVGLALVHSLIQELEEAKVLSQEQVKTIYGRALGQLQPDAAKTSFKEAITQLDKLRSRP